MLARNKAAAQRGMICFLGGVMQMAEPAMDAALQDPIDLGVQRSSVAAHTICPTSCTVMLCPIVLLLSPG